MRLDSIVAECREWFLDPGFAKLRALREGTPGVRMIGLFPVYTPEEVVLAAGLLPVHVYGGGTMVEIDHADSRLQSFVCSISRTTFELGLTGRLDVLDGMIFPSICDVSRNLSGLWRRNFPDRIAEFIHFPENLGSAHAVPYLRHELKRLEQVLSHVSGRAPSDEDYRSAFDLLNRHRRAVDEVYALRGEAPWNVPLAEAYAVLRAGGMMPREQHLRLLKDALAEWCSRQNRPQDRVRVILEGSFCEQPSLELLQTIEEAGCYVLNDDLLLGQRWFTAPLPLSGDPLEVLARHVLARCVPSAVHHPGPEGRGAALVEKARAVRADGVLFCMAKFCEPALYDYALLKRSVDAAGIPHLAFEFEEKMGTFESVRTQLETFVESILLFS
ncbi:MAG: 2-hydroxyacyl-CoA dehydratase [Candidatus Latescibacteria bacterium]|nr:2-hydroxyacyl-CoA dehydratase [Candidatus Latescibacterota bacterium]